MAQTVDDYIGEFAPEIQAILLQIRGIVREMAPEAQEKISYRMPAFMLNGALLYFAAFKQHIGVYPPVDGDEALMQALAPYRGPKGNLKFPLDEPMPFALIRRVVAARVDAQRARSA